VLKPVKFLLLAWILGMSLGSAARGDQSSLEGESQVVPSNFGLLKQTVEEAIEDVCGRLPLHQLDTLCLGCEWEAPGNWLVERALVEHLRSRGHQVIVLDNPLGACARETTLRYRLVDLDLIYPSSHRKHIFGPRMVERKVHLHVLLSLSSANGAVLWTGEVQRSPGDWISDKDLPQAERETVSFVSPRLKADSWGRFAEPALLTAVAGGLIYLFYSTQ